MKAIKHEQVMRLGLSTTVKQKLGILQDINLQNWRFEINSSQTLYALSKFPILKAKTYPFGENANSNRYCYGEFSIASELWITSLSWIFSENIVCQNSNHQLVFIGDLRSNNSNYDFRIKLDYHTDNYNVHVIVSAFWQNLVFKQNL